MFGRIIGTGSYVPEKIVTNDELSRYVDTSDQWVSLRTGVRKRHIMGLETTADMAVKAAEKALESAGILADQIDMIIVSSVSSNLILPNTACFVQEQIGAGNAFCLDVNAACTGFIMAYNTVQSYINAGLADTALIIGAEGLSRIVNWSDRTTCILFGDGAGAAVVQKDKNAVFDTIMKSDGRKGHTLTCRNEFASRIPFTGKEEQEDKSSTFVQMDGQEIFRFAVKQVPKCINELLDKINATVDEIDMFVLHQANLRILESISKRLQVPMKKIPVNVTEYGNTSSACIPILLDELFQKKKIKKGDKIIMSGFGGGLTLSATYLEI